MRFHASLFALPALALLGPLPQTATLEVRVTSEGAEPTRFALSAENVGVAVLSAVEIAPDPAGGNRLVVATPVTLRLRGEGEFTLALEAVEGHGGIVIERAAPRPDGSRLLAGGRRIVLGGTLDAPTLLASEWTQSVLPPR